MKEGWNDDDDYLILFDASESDAATAAYGLARYLPGYSILAIVGWDDLLIRNDAGELFRVPTLPLVQEHLANDVGLPDALQLDPDERFTGRIKWYVTPIVFGGDPVSESNIVWVDLPTHQELVCWWNDKYREAAGR